MTFIFCIFPCEDGALDLLLIQEYMSGFDFLALVLQSCNSFDLKALFQVLFSLNLTVYESLVQLTPSGSLCSTGFF